MKSKLLILFIALGFLGGGFTHAAAQEADKAEVGPEAATCLEKRLSRFLGTPFRPDGAEDEFGNWVLFSQPGKFFDSPGFNCSGFTVAAARELLAENFILSAVKTDRQGDSGPGSTLGEDWDFGLDLILNLSEGQSRCFYPAAANLDKPFENYAKGRAMGLGANIHSREFEQVLKELKPGRLTFFVISKPDRRFPAGVSYYHVGIILPDEKGGRWLYHSTAKAKTHRMNLGDPKILARFRSYFPAPKSGERRMFFVEVDLPTGLCGTVDFN